MTQARRAFGLARPSGAVIALSLVVAGLALVASGLALFWQDGPRPIPFRTVRGDTVQLYGHGLYQYDTLFFGAGNRGTDVVTLFVAVPLLLVCLVLYRRGSLRGRLLLIGILTYVLYVYASLAFGTAYNALFLVYVAVFSASLFALLLTFTSIDQEAFESRHSSRLPSRGPAVFMFASAAVLIVVWLGLGLLPAMMAGRPPKLLDSYTTVATYVLDLGIITPATFITGLLLLRRKALGYLMTFSLLGIILMLVPTIIAQTVSQLSAGVSLTPGEIVGPVGGFVLLGLFAAWVLIALLRQIEEPVESAHHQGWVSSQTS
jgi:hypothetical protein